MLHDAPAEWCADRRCVPWGGLQRGIEILQRTLSQLLIYYTRMAGAEGVLMKCGPEGVDLCKGAISHPAFIYEIKMKLKL